VEIFENKGMFYVLRLKGNSFRKSPRGHTGSHVRLFSTSFGTSRSGDPLKSRDFSVFSRQKFIFTAEKKIRKIFFDIFVRKPEILVCFGTKKDVVQVRVRKISPEGPPRGPRG